MKTLKMLLALSLTFLSLYNAHAQDVYYTPYENYDWRNGDYAIAGKINGLQYIYRSNNNGYYLDAYDDDMQKVATVKSTQQWHNEARCLKSARAAQSM